MRMAEISILSADDLPDYQLKQVASRLAEAHAAGY
jgi:hypothetical protein